MNPVATKKVAASPRRHSTGVVVEVAVVEGDGQLPGTGLASVKALDQRAQGHYVVVRSEETTEGLEVRHAAGEGVTGGLIVDPVKSDNHEVVRREPAPEPESVQKAPGSLLHPTFEPRSTPEPRFTAFHQSSFSWSVPTRTSTAASP